MRSLLILRIKSLLPISPCQGKRLSLAQLQLGIHIKAEDSAQRMESCVHRVPQECVGVGDSGVQQSWTWAGPEGPKDILPVPGVWGICSAVVGGGRWVSWLLGRGCSGLQCSLLNF